MRVLLRIFVLSFFFLSCIGARATKLYWVGGSGNFNDPSHWSIESGGIGGIKAPDESDDVYFDENSHRGKFIVAIIGGAKCHNLFVHDNVTGLVLNGTPNESIDITGAINIRGAVENQFAGNLRFRSSSTNSLNFGFFFPKGNIYFDGTGEWTLSSNLVTENTSTIYLRSGKLNVYNLGIICGGLVSDNSTFTLNLSNAYIHPLDQVALGNAMNYSVFQSEIEYNTSDPSNSISNAPSSWKIIDGAPQSLTPSNIDSCSCNGVCDGAATIAWTGVGAGGPFSIVWNSGTPKTFAGVAASPFNCTGLCSNVYIVQVKDKNGSTIPGASNTVTIPQPAPIVVNFDYFFQPSCNAMCNGQLSFFIIGGNHTYNVTWVPGPATFYLLENAEDTIKNLCSGMHVVTVVDRKGCVGKDSFDITQPTVLVPNGGNTNQLCAGVCTNMVFVSPSGGTPYSTVQSNGIFYHTVWDGNAALTNDTLYNLCPGTHTCVVTDSNACPQTVILTISPIPAITFVKNPASGALNILCNNTCNGIIGITGVTGGAGGYTYSWLPAGGTVSNTANSSTYSSVCGSPAGTTYTCTITDANNCTKTATFTVTSPTPLSNTITGTNPKCVAGQGVSVGSATVCESGGVAPYTFTWSPIGGTTAGVTPCSNYSNLPAGSYTVNVTDANGCLDTATITLTPPTAVSGNITSSINPTCPTLANGQICVTAAGGTGAGTYTYNWQPVGGNAACTPATLTVTAGGASVYTVTITDANSCTVTVTDSLKSPPQASIAVAQTNPACGSAPCTGSATLTPSGTPGPFTYAWSCSPSVTNTISGQCGGTTCTYTVTDQVTNCKYTGSVVFAPAPPVLVVNISATALNCNNDCNSVITSTVSGGTLPYTYSWTGPGVNPGGTSQVNMCAGTYVLQITDGLGCTKSATVTVVNPPALTVTVNATQPTCSGICDGSMTVTIGGGTAPYPGTIWSPSLPPPNSATTHTATNICGTPAPGTTYTVTITDNKGCVGTGTATMITPPALTVTVNKDSASCSGLCNGTATATASGGTGAYTYSWDGGAFTASATTSGLCAGSHTLNVKDASACNGGPIIFTIDQPNLLQVTVSNIVNTCGPCTGSAQANPTGGTPNYTYTWSPTGGNGPIASGLCIGAYTLTVNDSHNCGPVTATFSVNPIVVITLSATSQSVSCNNACDGTATASAANGTAPYSLVWTSSPTYTVVTSCASATCTANGLCPGVYVITASDNNGCLNKDSVTIGNPPVLTVSGSQTNATCFGTCSGSATVTPAGGTPAYTVNWSNGPSGPTQGNLCPGTYTANVLDSRGCPAQQTFTITSSPQFTVASTTTAPIACGGVSGSIEVTGSGGAGGPYTFSWLPPATGVVTTVSPTSTLSAIPAGVYTVTITDAAGCDTTLQITLSDPGSPTITVNSTPETCFGSCDGSATVTAVGVPAVTVSWQGGPASAPPLVEPNLCNSIVYVAQATDGNGCQAFQNVSVGGPTKITDAPVTIVQPNCSGAGGSITVTPGGGSGAGYTFCWDPNPACAQTTNPATGLAAGVHTLVLSDGTGCSQTFTYTINPASSLTVSVNTTTTSCSYNNDGTATAPTSGGTPPYSYTWTNSGGVVASGVNVNNVSNLPAGSYTLDVADNGACTSQQTFTITGATAINPNFVKVDNLCNGGCTGTATVAPTGGAGAYTYSWTPIAQSTPTVSGLCPLNYTVIVTDGNNCMDTTTFSIVAPPALTVTITSTDPTCNNVCNGSATVTATGGTGTTYTVNWGGGCLNCPIAINLCASPTQYTITTNDSNNCQNIQFLTLNNPTPILATPTTVDPVCAGDCNGSITSTTSGGTGPYTYTWSPAGGTVMGASPVSTYTNLCAPGPGVSTYTLIINDANGCADTTVHSLNPPVQLSMSASTTDATCGMANGSATITSTNGNGPVTVNWLPTPNPCGSSLNCGNLGAGIYMVELTDSRGCKDTLPIFIQNPNGPVIDSIVVHNTCNGSCSGSITINVFSGVNLTTPYTFSWTPPPGLGTITSGTNTSTYSGLCDGPYIGTVTDSIGCLTGTSFTITSPPAIQDNGNSTNATCAGINDGTITSIGSGGTPGTINSYTYTLDGITVNTTGIFSGLAVGVHTVCISDSLLCFACKTYTVNPNSQILDSIAATNITCPSLCNGVGTLSQVSGGTAPYGIVWSDGQTTLIANNLCAGTYTATITDANGCKAIDSITVIAPQPISPNPVVTSPPCGQCIGTISVAPTGGTPGTVTPYTYTWSQGGATTSSINNVCAGIYQVDIYDSLGCKQSFQVGVSNTNSPTIAVTSTSPVCSNACTGSATVTASGVSPFTYSWPSVPSNSSTISNQCAGTYFVQVQDSLGCIATGSAQITQSNGVNVSTSVTSPPCGVCNGTIIASANGGTGPYSYNWLPGGLTNDTITNMCAGSYTLIVTDLGTNCTDTNVVALNSANGPILTITSTNMLCNQANGGICSGTASVTASNGTLPYTYSWSNGQSGSSITNVCQNNYFVTVTDGAGCVQTSSVVVSQPNALISALPIITQPSCNNMCNGSLTTVISGGTPTYTYTWNPGSVSGVGGNALCPGNYSVTVTDANGCTITELDTLLNPALLAITGTVIPTSCSNISDGAINTTTTGGTPGLVAPGYTWQWSGGSNSTNDSITNIPAGTYTVVVTDSKNCTDTANFTVNSNVIIMVNAGPDTTACAIDTLVMNGTVSAGTAVQWFQLPNPPGPLVGSAPSATVTPALGVTQYVLIGLNGACSARDTITVTSNPLPTPDAGIGGSIFVGFSYTIGGSPTNPSGGTVHWSPGYSLSDSTTANPSASPTVTTTYTVYETNSSGCVAMDTVTVIILPTFIIPNGFTPNGDGYNDTWMIDNIQLFPDCEVEVFNRWGEPLFYSKGYNTPWNGTYRGKPVPVGTYYYLIRLHDKEGKFPDHFTGPLTILR